MGRVSVEDGPTRPLIDGSGSRSSHRTTPGSAVNHDSEVVDVVSHDEDYVESQRPTLFVWMLTVAAGLSGLLFGYDTGVISSTLVSIDRDLDGRLLTTLDKSLITAATSLFALVASPCAGYLADTMGRKKLILLASCMFVTGALGQAVSTSIVGMIIGRSVVGCGVGAASFIAPLYIGELAPRQWRGRLVTVSSLFITGGQVLAYVLGWLLSTPKGGWRWLVGLGAVPAILQLAMLIFIPESARWLVKSGQVSGAEIVLTKTYGSGPRSKAVIGRILCDIQQEVQKEELLTKASSTSAASDLLSVGRHRRALMISCMLMAGQQICGFNSLMYYSATIFSLVGFASPTLTSLSIAIANFLFTLVAFCVIDQIGRRRTLLLSIPWMAIGLLASAFAFKFVDLQTMTSIDSFDPKLHTPRWAASLLVMSLILYVSAYALGLGNVPWQQGELFSLRVRSVGSSLSSGTNWLANTVVGLTFLPMMDFLTPTFTFAFYALVCAVTWIGIWHCYPETAGLRLEEVGQLLDTDWGVDDSVERFRASKAQRT